MDKEILTYINSQPVYKNFIEDLPYNPQLKERARKLRKAGNYPEVVFWRHVHQRNFHNLDFDRQRVIGNYIVDFYIKTLGLIIEIDGSSHNEKDIYDEQRELILKSFNLEIFKISSFRVLHDLENVMTELEHFIIQHFSHF